MNIPKVLNSDSFYRIGKHHTICQDYALSHHEDGKTLLLVSDGCSSSPQSEWGARMIPSIFLKHWRFSGRLPDVDSVILNAQGLLPAFNLYDTALDATLITASTSENNDEWDISFYGDGFAIAEYENEIVIFSSSYEDKDGNPTNAPNYLSYKLSEKLDFYKSYYKNCCLRYRKDVYDKNSLKQLTSTSSSNDVEHYAMPLAAKKAGLNKLIICSDGLASFYKNNISSSEKRISKISELEIVSDFLKFNQFGNFLQKRYIKLAQNFEKKEIFHSDDWSCAGAVMEREEKSENKTSQEVAKN